MNTPDGLKRSMDSSHVTQPTQHPDLTDMAEPSQSPAWKKLINKGNLTGA